MLEMMNSFFYNNRINLIKQIKTFKKEIMRKEG